MSYVAREQSAYAGQPLELYRFSMGAQQWLYTSADIAVDLLGDSYQPGYIRRGGFTRCGDARKNTMDIEVSASHPVALLFRTGWLPEVMVVTVSRHHYGDSDYAVIWKGRITGCKWADSTATLTSDSVFTLFQRAGLRRVYQAGCPHVLYGSACVVPAASWSVAATVAAVGGVNMTLATIAGYGDGYFSGGMLQAGNELRMITGHSGNGITVVDVIAGLAVGAAVTVWPGCGRDLATCSGRFNNAVNFGGLPYLPKKNPFSGDALV